MNDTDNADLAAITDWLQRYQGMPKTAGQGTPIDPSHTVGGVSDMLQSRLAELSFDSEPARYLRLLHDLAPAELRGNDE